MVVLPPSDRRPTSTLMSVIFHDLWGVLEGARSTRRDVIDPSIRSRSMDPGLAAWGLPSSQGGSIITWGTILLLFLLVVISVRTMISTRTSRPAYLLDTEEDGVYICQGRQRRAWATLKIGIDLGDSSCDPKVSPIAFQTLSAATELAIFQDLCPHRPIDTEAPPPYSTTVAHADSDSYVPRPSAAFAASYGRQHVHPRSNSNAYIHVTVLVATPSDTTNVSLRSSRHSGLRGVVGDLTDSEVSVTDSECASTYSDSEDEWDRMPPPLPSSPYMRAIATV
jgi:hypothetical protein